jgi:acetyl-CoA C-acetyltransferase
VAVDPRAPCIIGVARRTWREEPAPEPLDMWEAMAREAAADAGAPGAVAGLDSIQVVFCQSWEYDDPSGRLAGRLGADPSHRSYSGLGGSVPVRLLSGAASAMADGQLDLALVVGGEALATRSHLPDPAWSHAPETPSPYPITVDRTEARHGIFQAYLTFALLDSARRQHLGRSMIEHQQVLGQLLAPLSEVAAKDPEHAWFPIARDAAEIATPSPANRMVATPSTKYMTAIMDVDMAAAVLVATEARADALGVPADRRVYLRGSGAAEEPATMAARPDLWRSPAMGAAFASALGPVPADDVAHLDLYSCFASSLAFAADTLGATGDRQLTVTGGLPYHGGPGSNYTTHALAAMVETLRSDPDAYGLVTGIGMHMTSHAAALLSTRPGPVPTPAAAPELPTVPVVSPVDGPAVVQAWSTVYGRQGPEWTALIAERPDGSRCYARVEEPPDEDVDLSGRTVTVVTGENRITTATL